MSNPPRLSPRWTSALLIALVCIHVLPFPWTTLILDGARDVSFALAIADGRQLPLQGPLINETIHLGPIWFYFLSLPLLLTRSLTVVAVTIGLVSALKFPLGYAVGRRLGGPYAGLLFCLALAIPGWESGTLLTASHISVIETAVLLCFYPLVRLYLGGGRWWWLGYGIAQGLALHAHPATVLCGLLTPWVILRRGAFRADLLPVLAGIFASMLWFVPMLYSEHAAGWPMLQQLSNYAHTTTEQGFATRFAAVSAAAWIDPPVFLSGWAFPAGLSAMLRLIYALLFGLALLGLVLRLRDRLTRSSVLLLVATTVVAGCLLVLLRERTPHYMLLCWVPFQAACLAVGWSAFRKGIGGLLAAVIVTLAAGNAWGLIRVSSDGLADIPSTRLFDVASRSPETRRSEQLPIWALDRLSINICNEPRPVVLHGPVALLFDVSGAVGVQTRCPERLDQISIGGAADLHDVRHLLGLTPAELHEVGIDSDWRTAISLEPVAVLGSETSAPAVAGPAYPFRNVDHSERRTRTFEQRLESGTRVMMGMPLAPYGGGTPAGAHGADGPLTPVLETVGMRVYRIPSGGMWSFACRTGTQGDCDVVIF